MSNEITPLESTLVARLQSALGLDDLNFVAVDDSAEKHLVLPDKGIPLNDLQHLGQLAGVAELTDALPDELAGFNGLNLNQLVINTSDEMVAIEVRWNDGHFPIIPDLIEIEQPGLLVTLVGFPELEDGWVDLLGTASFGSAESSDAAQLAVSISLPSMSVTAQLIQPCPLAPLLDHFDLDGTAFGQMQIDALLLTASPHDKLMSISMGMGAVWEPGGGFSLEQLVIRVTSFNGAVSGRLSARGTMADIDVTLNGEHAGPGLGWVVSAEVAHEHSLEIGEAIQLLAHEVGADEITVPTMLNSMPLADMGFSYITNSGDVSVHGLVPFDVSADKHIDLRIEAALVRNPDGSGFEFESRVNLSGQKFTLNFAKQEGDDAALEAFVATYDTPQRILLQQIIAAVTDADIEAAVPPLTIDLQHVMFAYAKQGQQSAMLFGIDLDAKLMLDGLPVVGSSMPSGVGVDGVQLLYATSDINRGQRDAFNSILPDGESLPEPPTRPSKNKQTASNQGSVVAVRHGISVSTTLNLGAAGSFPLYSGAGAANLPGGQHPALTAPGSAPIQTSPPPPAPTADAVWINIQKKLGPVTLQKIGGRFRDGRIWVLFSAELSAGPMALELQGLGLGFKLDKLDFPDFSLDGLGLSYSSGPLTISGLFLKGQGPEYDADGQPTGHTITQYGGQVRVQAETYSILAVGSYGKMANGDPSLFIYGALSAAAGQGIHAGPVTITALALGFGINRRVLIPTIEGVSQFPLVKMVMDTATGPAALAPPAQADPAQIQAQLNSVLPAQPGQFFGAIGMRFSLFETIDCFGLAIIQAGREMEITILGVGRFKKPDVGPPLCYVEIDLLVDIQPQVRSLKVDALLSNSWVLDQHSRIEGQFVLYIWYGGPHKGDFVISLGGYHADFVPPAHYPIVRPLTLNWQVNPLLTVTGSLYFAITPAAFMAGGVMVASYRAGPVGADFTAHADFLIYWKPLYYDIRVGISVRAYADLWLFTVHVTLSVDLVIQGPPMHGTAELSIGPVSVTVGFGDRSTKPPVIAEWSEFGRNFLDRTEGAGKWDGVTPEKGVGPIIHQLQLLQGTTPKPGVPTHEDAPEKKPDPHQSAERWFVRGDELVMAVSTVIPASTYEVGTVLTKADHSAELPILIPADEHDDPWTSRPLTVNKALELEANPPHSDHSKASFGIRPMDKRHVDTHLKVAIIREVKHDSGESAAVDLTKWTINADRTRVPAALWDPEAMDPKTPSAKTIKGSISGLRQIQPPTGGPRGEALGPIHGADMGWDDLAHKVIVLPHAAQAVPTQLAQRPDVNAALAEASQRRQEIANLLAHSGFLEVQDLGSATDFRPLNAATLATA